jgi:hypothetical protein
MKRGADWFAWSLQFIVGLVIGAFIGVATIARRRTLGGGWWLASDQVSTFIWGAALIGAGLASFYGDRLWLGSSFRVIPPDGIKHSDTSSMVSILTGLLGVVLVLRAILRHFGYL